MESWISGTTRQKACSFCHVQTKKDAGTGGADEGVRRESKEKDDQRAGGRGVGW